MDDLDPSDGRHRLSLLHAENIAATLVLLAVLEDGIHALGAAPAQVAPASALNR